MTRQESSLYGHLLGSLNRLETRVVNWALVQRPYPIHRNPHFWAISVLFVVFTVLYYADQLGLARSFPNLEGFFITVHDLHRGLLFIPIIYASLVFRMLGGIVSSLLFLLVILPRALAFSPYPDSVERAIIFFIPATLISWLIAALLERVKRARADKEQLAKLHEELAESLGRLQVSEEQLIQAEKLSSLGQMAASIAHEINNPLAGVLVYTQLMSKKLARGTMDTDVALDYLAKMAREVDRSSRIIRNLLDFARPSELNLSDVDINQVVEDALALVGHRATLGQIEVIEELQKDLPKVYADYDQLRQVLVNLTLNAIQATPIGGRVTLRTRTTANNLLQVVVEDTGHGITDGNRQKLFTPFFTTKEKGEGVGLGLAVAKGIVEKHSGRIDVESVTGEGTTFMVSLPVHHKPSLSV